MRARLWFEGDTRARAHRAPPPPCLACRPSSRRRTCPRRCRRTPSTWPRRPWTSLTSRRTLPPVRTARGGGGGGGWAMQGCLTPQAGRTHRAHLVPHGPSSPLASRRVNRHQEGVRQKARPHLARDRRAQLRQLCDARDEALHLLLPRAGGDPALQERLNRRRRPHDELDGAAARRPMGKGAQSKGRP